MKSDHDIVLLDTAHQPQRLRLPRRKIYLWKKANVEGIKHHMSQYRQTFSNTTFQSIECMWASFKSAITSALEQYVPTKMSSTRQTHPWVTTKLRRLMRRKQRAHWRARKSGKPKEWERYQNIQAKFQKETRTAEKTYLHNVVSDDLKKNPKRFWTYIKSKKQESEGVSPLINSDAFYRAIAQERQTYSTINFNRYIPPRIPPPFQTKDQVLIQL